MTVLTAAQHDLQERQVIRWNPLDVAKYVARKAYAWPGGYAMVLVTEDGGILCPECVRSEWRNVVQDWLWRDGMRGGSGWLPAGMTHTGETDESLICDHCSQDVAS